MTTTNTDGSGVMLDYKTGDQHSISPFFGAGTAKPIDWIYRDEGTKITATGLVDDADKIENKNNLSEKIAVVSAQISGIAGYTRYQGQVSMVKIPV